VDGVVVAHEELPGVHLHGGHVVGSVPVARRQGVERQPEPLDPALPGPDLLGLEHLETHELIEAEDLNPILEQAKGITSQLPGT
jgi:hypothetical protein